MMNDLSRRDFMKRSLLASAAGAAAVSLEERALLAEQTQPTEGTPKFKLGQKNTLPTGKLGNLELSRLILGGNLIGGWAHSRDLIYVSDLLQHYFTPEKIMDTFEIAEAHGINVVNTHPNATAVVRRYWKERGGKIKWMVQGFPNDRDNYAEIKASIDAGADALYIQGNVGDQLAKGKRVDLIAKAIEFIKLNGIPAGVAGHSLKVPMECEKAGVPVDFYVKTLHMNNYFSFHREDNDDIGHHDNLWCDSADETIAFMNTVKKPWIAYKVMAAGAIPPRPAFQHAFDNGADFILAGIFDFQIAEDAQIAKEVLAKANRVRPWLA